MTFNGEERKFVANDAGVYLGFLMDDAGKGKFFLFNTEDATFAPFAQIAISDTTSLIVVDAPKSAKLPSSYQEVDMTVQEENFPAWSDPSNSRYYVIYALNTRTGEKSFYQYDTEDGTYQYFEAPKEETKKKDSESGIVAKLGEFVAENTMVVLVAAAALFLLLLILAIVFAVKLVHRNQELDDLYDEYGIDLDEEEEALKAKKKEEKQEKKAKKASKQVSKKASKKYDDENEFEGYDEDDLWVTENIAKAMEKPKKQKSVKHATAKKAAAKGVRSLDETGPAIRKPVKNINLQDTDDFEKFTPLDEEEFDNF